MIPREVIRQVRQIQIRTRHLVQEVFAGEYHSVFKGRGMEFDEVREYVPGDDVRAIDWNVTARMGHPYIKKFVEERELTVMLAVDVSASHAFGSRARLKRDLLAELAAVLAFSAVRNHDRAGLLLFSDRVERYIPPAKGATHVLRVIREALGHRPRHPGTDVRPALEFLLRVLRRRCVCFLMSDFLFPDPAERELALAARRHDLIAVRAGDRREQAWPDAGLVWWEDAETGRRRRFDTSDRRVREAVARRFAAHRAAWQARFRRYGVDAIEVETGVPYDRALRRFFQTRERRRRAG
jgi:uncharacterized protein (DUF58 family)